MPMMTDEANADDECDDDGDGGGDGDEEERGEREGGEVTSARGAQRKQ